jgi:hypothetical protein
MASKLPLTPDDQYVAAIVDARHPTAAGARVPTITNERTFAYSTYDDVTFTTTHGVSYLVVIDYGNIYVPTITVLSKGGSWRTAAF